MSQEHRPKVEEPTGEAQNMNKRDYCTVNLPRVTRDLSFDPQPYHRGIFLRGLDSYNAREPYAK